MTIKRKLGLLAAGLAFCAGASGAWAAQWPERTVNVIVPYGPGSSPDGFARAIFDTVSRNTGQSFVIENKPGAGGMIGAGMVAKAAPDGYTLVLADSAPFGINTLLYKKMAYDPFKDLEPVAAVAEGGFFIAVNSDTKITNIKELFEAINAPGSKFSYSSSGIGTQGHLVMSELMNRGGEAARAVPHVPYPSSAKAVSALVANDVQVSTLPAITAMPQIRAERIRPIAIIGAKRLEFTPDVPTLKEQGYDLSDGAVVGVMAPAGTPDAVIDQIHKEITRALKEEVVLNSFKAQGLDVSDKGPAEFTAYLKKEVARWKPVIEKQGISLD